MKILRLRLQRVIVITQERNRVFQVNVFQQSWRGFVPSQHSRDKEMLLDPFTVHPGASEMCGLINLKLGACTGSRRRVILSSWCGCHRIRPPALGPPPCTTHRHRYWSDEGVGALGTKHVQDWAQSTALRNTSSRNKRQTLLIFK